MLHIDYNGRRPIYEQLCEQIKQMVLLGVYAPGSQLPSVRQLAVELALNPNTVQRAFSELERQGVICPVKGKGNFISQDEEMLRRQSRLDILQELRHTAKRARDAGIEKQELVTEVAAVYDADRGERA